MTRDKTQPIDFTEDYLDMRDIVARAEWLEEHIATLLGREEPELDEDCIEELRHCGSDDWADEAELLLELFNDTRNEAEGIDTKHLIEWRGDWYPALLIADYAMEEHAQTIVADNDLIGDGIPHKR